MLDLSVLIFINEYSTAHFDSEKGLFMYIMELPELMIKLSGRHLVEVDIRNRCSVYILMPNGPCALVLFSLITPSKSTKKLARFDC